jgi:putative transcription factor
MDCELCGKHSKELSRVIVEGVLFLVCNRCAKFGRTAQGLSFRKLTKLEFAERLKKRALFLKEKDIFEEQKGELVEDYSKRIREARLKLGLTPEQLGKKINERKTVITKLESGAMRPTDELVRKLERALGIKLVIK